MDQKEGKIHDISFKRSTMTLLSINAHISVFLLCYCHPMFLIISTFLFLENMQD